MNFFDLLGSIPGFLDKFSLVMVAGFLAILVIGLLWSKMPKPKFTKPKTKSKPKAVRRLFPKNISPSIKIISVIIGVSLWATGFMLGQFSNLKWLGLYIYFIGWVPYILALWVL